jgi:hypothetical protein
VGRQAPLRETLAPFGQAQHPETKRALYFEECVVGDSIVDTSSERHEVAPQRDCDQESRHLARQLRVNEDMIMDATRCIDDTHALVACYCWRALIA